MDKQLRGYVAETLGVFLVVLLGGSAVCASLLPQEQFHIDLWAIALAEGFALAVVLPIVYRESPGCLNPAVTLTFWVCKRLEGRQTAILIALQLIGSVLAGMALHFIFPDNVIRFATPHVGKTILDMTNNETLPSQLLGILVETLLTFFFTIAVFGLLIDRRANRFDGVAVGLARCAIVIAGYNLTGAAANPARWFGPYVWQFATGFAPEQSPIWDHPVYWVGPVVGALAAGWLYTKFLLPPDQAKGEGP